MDNNIIYWIWLSQIKGIGSHTARQLLAEYKEPKLIYEWNQKNTEKMYGLTKRQVNSMVASRDLQKAQTILESCYKNNISIMTEVDKEFPKMAKDNLDMPILFYYQGIPKINDYEKTVGIIGSRRCSHEGKKRAIEIATDFTRQEIPVISGMAKGIDSYAHTAVLRNSGYTVAVLGHGLDYCYPKEHKELMKCIILNGMVLSEYPPDIMPKQYYFLQRNRIIAALSNELYVVDIGSRSGAMSTIEFARKYGHKVYIMD